MSAGMDWGIARIDNWKDTVGLDLTPLTLALLCRLLVRRFRIPLTRAIISPTMTMTRRHGTTWIGTRANCGWVGTNHRHVGDPHAHCTCF